MPFTFRLGDFDFEDFEIPEEIGLGGEQMVAVHKFVGGDRKVDTLGRDDAPVTWSGRFRGSDAVDRCLQIDAMRVGGLSQQLIIGPFRRTVVVQRFEYRPQKLYEIPYTIGCIVITDDSVPLAAAQGPTVDDMMASDAGDLGTLATNVGDSTLSGLVTTLQGGVAAVPSFAAADTATTNGVLGDVNAVLVRVNALIAATETTIDGQNTLGGVVVGSPVASALNLTAQAGAFGEQPQLYDMQALLGRMTTNLLAIRSSGAQVTQAGGDLWSLAAAAYGTAAEWATIAAANGLTDPDLSGVNTILIPPASASTDGVLQP